LKKNMRHIALFLAAVLVAGSMTAKADQTAIQTPASSDSLAAPTATPDTPEAAPATGADTTDQAAPTPDMAAPVATEQPADPIPAGDTVGGPTRDADAPSGGTILSGILGMILAIAGIAFILCLFPALIAFKRRHKDRIAILVLSIFFGWLPFAWVIALIWSLTGNVEAKA
jgi:Superinfection immunity protein